MQLSYSWWTKNLPERIDDGGIGVLLKKLEDLKGPKTVKEIDRLVKDCISGKEQRSVLVLERDLTLILGIYQKLTTKTQVFVRAMKGAGRAEVAKDTEAFLRLLKDAEKNADQKITTALTSIKSATEQVEATHESAVEIVDTFIANQTKALDKLRKSYEQEKAIIGKYNMRSSQTTDWPSHIVLEKSIGIVRTALDECKGTKYKAKDVMNQIEVAIDTLGRSTKLNLRPDDMLKIIRPKAKLEKMDGERKNLVAEMKAFETILAAWAVKVWGKEEGIKNFVNAKPVASIKSGAAKLKFKSPQI